MDPLIKSTPNLSKFRVVSAKASYWLPLERSHTNLLNAVQGGVTPRYPSKPSRAIQAGEISNEAVPRGWSLAQTPASTGSEEHSWVTHCHPLMVWRAPAQTAHRTPGEKMQWFLLKGVTRIIFCTIVQADATSSTKVANVIKSSRNHLYKIHFSDWPIGANDDSYMYHLWPLIW